MSAAAEPRIHVSPEAAALVGRMVKRAGPLISVR